MKFSEIVGQSIAIGKVKDAISNGRLAHALMLTGPEGVGQLPLATAIAQYVNCLNPQKQDSCGTCSNCVKIHKAIHPDVKLVLPIYSKISGGKRYLTEDFLPDFREEFTTDPYMSFSAWQRRLGGQNKQLFTSVHEIRHLKKGIYLKAFEAKFKVVILWRAELINTAGANAFLKLLEEPPDRTLLILTCSDPSRLLTTINSRCQRIPMQRISSEDIASYLITSREIDQMKAEEVANIAEGSMAKASEYLTESNHAISEMYRDWLRMVYVGDYQKIQEKIEPIFKENKEFQKLFLQIAIQKIRDAMLYHAGTSQLALASHEEQQFLQKFSPYVSPEKVEAIVRHMEDSHRFLSGNAHPQMVFTTLSLRMHTILRT
ncbi:MAG: hypothetical protein AAF587_01940 [Bacteroidota bacterium]